MVGEQTWRFAVRLDPGYIVERLVRIAVELRSSRKNDERDAPNSARVIPF